MALFQPEPATFLIRKKVSILKHFRYKLEAILAFLKLLIRGKSAFVATFPKGQYLSVVISLHR